VLCPIVHVPNEALSAQSIAFLKNKAVAGLSWKVYYFYMKSIEEIESAIKNLPPEDLTRFRKWYDEFEASQWDREIEEDVHAGRLEQASGQAVKDLHEGRCTEL
jgi:hypothetical protein